MQALADADERALAILRDNVGFMEPHLWIEYAIRNRFHRVPSMVIPACPDCGAEAAGRLGQFIYYSTLIQLRSCASCELIWADVHLDVAVTKAHFELSYKNLDYFLSERSEIFSQLADLASSAAPVGGSVLDVGGAQGHLMHTLGRLRPDLQLVVHDISRSAIDYAASELNLRTVCGDVSVLEQMGRQFDVVVLSDVLYYEPQLHRAWAAIASLVCDGGTVILRVPNHLPLILLAQSVKRSVSSRSDMKLQDRLRFFNPEHLFVLSPRYLARRLSGLGFSGITVMPSPLLVDRRWVFRLAKTALYKCARAFGRLSGFRIALTPGMVVHGVKRTRSVSSEHSAAGT